MRNLLNLEHATITNSIHKL
jgi:hypothetical protein